MRVKLLTQRLNYMYEGMESKVLCTELRIRIRVRRVNCNETMLTEDVPSYFLRDMKSHTIRSIY